MKDGTCQVELASYSCSSKSLKATYISYYRQISHYPLRERMKSLSPWFMSSVAVFVLRQQHIAINDFWSEPDAYVSHTSWISYNRHSDLSKTMPETQPAGPEIVLSRFNKVNVWAIFTDADAALMYSSLWSPGTPPQRLFYPVCSATILQLRDKHYTSHDSRKNEATVYFLHLLLLYESVQAWRMDRARCHTSNQRFGIPLVKITWNSFLNLM